MPSSSTIPRQSILWRELSIKIYKKNNCHAFAYNYSHLCNIGNRLSQRQNVWILLERLGRS